MDIKKDFADKKLQEEGVWLDYRDDSKVKIASVGNPAFIAHQDKLRGAYRGVRTDRDGRLPSKIETEIFCKAMAKHVLLDWEGFTNDGKPLDYSEETAFQLLMENVFFRNDIAGMASQEANFIRERDEDTAKNFSTPSSGI